MSMNPQGIGLERELAAYERNLHALLPEQGKYVLIAEDDVLGTFGDYGDALAAGYEKRDLRPFLVKRIEATETAHHFSRDMGDLCLI